MELTIEQALQQGVAAHKEGKLQEAERLYRAILQSQPAHPDANHNLGVLAVSLNKVDAALPLFKTALEANPKIEQFWLSYIDALVKAKHVNDAKQAIKKAEKKGFDAKKLQALVSQSKGVTDNKVPSQQLLNSLMEHYQSGQYDDAENLALSITDEYPKHPFGWKVLGAVLGATGRKSEAVDASQTAVVLSPEDADAHYNLGNKLKELGSLDEAEASYNQAIALNPDFAEAQSNLGVTLQELGRLDEAEASCKKAIAMKPGFAEAHYNLGNTLKELGRLDEAEASYNQAIALKPDLAEAHNNFGNILREQGRLDEAEASYNQAITSKPDFAEAHYGLSKVLYKMGNKDSALESLKKANAIDPKSKDIQLLLSVLKAKKVHEDTEGRVKNILPSDILSIPPSKILELNMSVEQELITYLYSKELLDLDKRKDPSFGDTKGSKYDLFDDSHSNIQRLETELNSILTKAFNSNIFIADSFFSIFGAGGGTGRHNHVNKKAKIQLLV